MARKSYLTETVETAYRTWRECGQNVEMTLRQMEKKGWKLSRPTIYEWADKYAWKDRAARAEAEEHKAADAVKNAEDNAVRSLEKVRERYERYFDAMSEGTVDNQAMYAYTGVVKSIAEIKMKTGAFKASLFLDFMKDLIDWLSKNDPALLAAFEAHFDDFVRYAREKYQ